MLRESLWDVACGSVLAVVCGGRVALRIAHCVLCFVFASAQRVFQHGNFTFVICMFV